MTKEKAKEKIKILAVVFRVNKGKKEFLVLRNNPKDPIHGGDYYYVVTGGVEKESLTDALKREIKEETGIEKIINVKNLNKIYTYKNPGEGDILCKEYCFLVKVEGDVKKLSQEHVEYKWLEKDEFLKTVYWYGDKKDLEAFLN